MSGIWWQGGLVALIGYTVGYILGFMRGDVRKDEEDRA